MENATGRERVRRFLLNEQLPTAVPEWLSVGGPGNGRDCRVCTAPITRHDIQVELDGDLVVHSGCYLLWKEEAEAKNAPDVTQAPHDHVAARPSSVIQMK